VSTADRIDAFQRRHKTVGMPLAVLYKYFDDQGNYLAALMTYYAFIALIPLLLLASSILGFILAGNESLQQKILDSALAQYPVINQILQEPGGPKGSTWAIVIGALGALYGAMGVAQAMQNAMNIAWSVPRNRRPNPFIGRIRSLGLLVTAGLGIMATTWVSTLGTRIDALDVTLTPWLKVALIGATVLVNAVIFTLLFRLATTHEHSLRLAFPGGLTTAVLWQGLQYVGTLYATEVVQHATRVNQLFASFLGIIVYLYVGAICILLGVEVNVVKAHHLYPRALLTPFTDNVDLTEADRRAYADYAAAQRTKDFAHVDVRFEFDGQFRSAKRRAAAQQAAEEQAAMERAEADGDDPTDELQAIRERRQSSSDLRDPNPTAVTDRTADRPHDHH
jgi:YihY family inner membrane protein